MISTFIFLNFRSLFLELLHAISKLFENLRILLIKFFVSSLLSSFSFLFLYYHFSRAPYIESSQKTPQSRPMLPSFIKNLLV